MRETDRQTVRVVRVVVVAAAAEVVVAAAAADLGFYDALNITDH